MSLLPAGAEGFGLVKIAVAPLREAPGHDAEMGTQAMLGTPVALDSVVDGEWWRLTLPCGYRGYIHVSSIKELTDDEARQWRGSRRLVADRDVAYLTDIRTGRRAGYVPYGGVVEYGRRLPDGMMEVILPSGERARGAASDFMELTEKAARNGGKNLEDVIALGYRMLGSPYLWGGTTMLGADCSGFTQLCWQEAGLLLPRNASQQARAGEEVTDIKDARRGDLIFYTSPRGRVDHVSMYLGDGKILQSSGHVFEATINREDATPECRYYGRKPAYIRRFTGAATGLRLADNPMYFNE